MSIFNDAFLSQDEVEVNGSSDAKSVCVRAGCNNPAVESDDWDKEYCSNECVATHCRCVESIKKIFVLRFLNPFSCS